MARVNDVGGQSGLRAGRRRAGRAAVPRRLGGAGVALNGALMRRGVYNLDEFRDAIERMPPAEYLAASYYERWFTRDQDADGEGRRRAGRADG